MQDCGPNQLPKEALPLYQSVNSTVKALVVLKGANHCQVLSLRVLLPLIALLIVVCSSLIVVCCSGLPLLQVVCAPVRSATILLGLTSRVKGVCF